MLLPRASSPHIHFGKEHVAGGVMVFFCSNLAGHLFTINWTVVSLSWVMDKCEPSRRNHSRGTHAINAALYKKLPHDAQRDFTAIALVAQAPVMIVSGATID